MKRAWLKTFRIYDHISGENYTFFSPREWNAYIGHLKSMYGDLCVVHTVKYKPRVCCIFKAEKQ